MNDGLDRIINWTSKHPVLLISQMCWIGVFIFFGYSGYGASGETGLATEIFLMMMSFPSCFILRLFSPFLELKNVDSISFGLVATFFIIGYLQWFVLLPFLFGKIKAFFRKR